MNKILINKSLTLITFFIFIIVVIYNVKEYFVALPEVIKILLLLTLLIVEIILSVKFFLFQHSKKEKD